LNETVAQIFVWFLYLLIVAVLARSLLSWFPVSPRNQYVQLLVRVTEPLLEPVRRIMPRTGMIDLSGFVVIIVLYIMINVVHRAANT
jgi:YggT family protein